MPEWQEKKLGKNEILNWKEREYMRMEKLWLAFSAILLLAFSFGCVSSGSPGNGNYWNTGNFWVWGWASMVGAAVLLVVAMLALSWMGASFTNDEKAKAWVKTELGQLIYSLLIIAVVLATVGALDASLKLFIASAGTNEWKAYVNGVVCCDPAQGACLTFNNRPCHMAIAYDFLQIMYESLRANAVSYMMNYGLFSFLSNLKIGMSAWFAIHLGGFDVRPFAGLATQADFFSILFDLAVKNMMLMRVQQIFLDYFLYALFPLMMSMGLVLRMFYFTRKLGGLFIALSLAVYYVFPGFYVLADAIYSGFIGPWTQRPSTFGTTFDQNSMLLPTQSQPQTLYDEPGQIFHEQPVNVFEVCGGATSDELNAHKSVFSTFRDRWDAVEGSNLLKTAKDWFKGLPLVGSHGPFSPEGPIGSLAAMMVFTLLVPFLALMTTLASFKALSQIIGGDVEIALLSRLL